VTLADGDTVIAEGSVERTLPFFFSMDETVDVGEDLASPVSSDYGPTGNAFTGKIKWVRIDIGDDDHDHLLDPDHLLNIAMTRQ
jgi:arylsulfatase